MAKVDIEPRAPLMEFTLFPELPKELRDVIWAMTFEPRIVVIKFDRNTSHVKPLYNRSFFSETKIPTTAKICREAREVFLKSYELCLGSLWYPASTRINFTLDTLYLRQDDRSFHVLHLFFNILNDKELTRLRYLALDRGLFCIHRDSPRIRIPGLRATFYGALERSIRALKGLRELLVVGAIPVYTIRATGKWNFVHAWQRDDDYDEDQGEIPCFYYSVPQQLEDINELIKGPSLEEAPSLPDSVRRWDFVQMRPVWNWPHDLFFEPANN